MKISLVPKPVPSDAVVQIQKNVILRKINQLEKSPDEIERAKAVLLRQQLKEIEQKRQQQKDMEKRELLQVKIRQQERKKLDNLKLENNEKKDPLRNAEEGNGKKRKYLVIRGRFDRWC